MRGATTTIRTIPVAKLTIRVQDRLYGITQENQLFSFQESEPEPEINTYGSSVRLTAMAHFLGSLFILGRQDGRVLLWETGNNEFSLSMQLLNEPVTGIYVYGNYAYILGTDTTVFVSVQQDRPHRSCRALQAMCDWSYKWKLQVLRRARQIIRPVIVSCLLHQTPIEHILKLLSTCTEEYEHRGLWCQAEFIDILLLQQPPQPGLLQIIRRLLTFRGHKFDCSICRDVDSIDDIVYLEDCHHHFHQRCIQTLVEKTPEYHNEMQYQYALTVALRCPICRAPFREKQIHKASLMSEMLKHD
jgi:hypothetical protein